jgi:chaperonin GroES
VQLVGGARTKNNQETKTVSEKIIPFGDNVVVQLLEQQKTKGGIIIPDKAKTNQRDAIVGKVVAVGEGRFTEFGATVMAQAKVGDYVLLSRGAGTEIELAPEDRGKDARKLRVLRDCELLGKVEESRIIQLGLDRP